MKIPPPPFTKGGRGGFSSFVVPDPGMGVIFGNQDDILSNLKGKHEELT